MVLCGSWYGESGEPTWDLTIRIRGGDHDWASLSNVEGSISTAESRPMEASDAESLGPSWCQLVDARRRSEREGFRGTVPGGCLSAAA